jgi:hypothetical protein
MSVGKVLTRLRLSLGVCFVVAVAAGILAGSAGAQPPADASGLKANGPIWTPNETTVPYLAWRGDAVRLVKCTDDLGGLRGAPTIQSNGSLSWGLDVSMTVFAYSGPQENSFDGPKFLQGSASIFWDDSLGQPCVRADITSNKPGIVIVKLTISTHGVLQGVHDFLVGFMAVNSANITNPGSVTEDPGTEPGNSVNVQVTGSIPLNQEFQDDYGLPATLVLPNDWALWANTAMAQVDNNEPGPASQYWDIHDSSGPLGNETPDGSPDVHVNQSTCPGSTPDAFVDQVDNCNGPGPGNGINFSRIFGDFGSGIGPFDPSYNITLLSDGRLNSSDAPMPPLKIVFNSSGGMGGFDNSILSDKRCVYNRNSDLANGNCVTPGHNVNEAHALYAPYYSAWIPATARNPYGAASGTDGPQFPGQPNNFPGYNYNDRYFYWDIAQTLVQGSGGPSDCLLTTNQEPIFRNLNGFPTRVVEFTDEHGEARAQWQPGLDADFFNNFVDPVQGGCDLEGVTFPAQTITASARYPFQNIVANDIAATGTITKNINNLFHKDVVCTIKANHIGYICTASAIDINGDGTVFNGEYVCFSREPENIWFDVGGSIPHENGYCVQLSGGGPGQPAEVSVETPATIPGNVIDVLANFTGEHLWRDTCIVTGQPVSGLCSGVGSGTTTGTGTSGTGTSGTGTSGTGTSGITIYGDGGKVTKKAGKATLASAQFVLTKQGRVLMVKVRSASLKTVKIQVRLMNAKGRVIATAVRVVKTNKRVAVPHLRISKSVSRAAVKVLG